MKSRFSMACRIDVVLREEREKGRKKTKREREERVKM